MGVKYYKVHFLLSLFSHPPLSLRYWRADEEENSSLLCCGRILHYLCTVKLAREPRTLYNGGI